MRDKILRTLRSNPKLDGVLGTSFAMAKYISDNKDEKYRELSPRLVKKVVFEDREKIQKRILADETRKIQQDLDRHVERLETQALHKKTFEGLSRFEEISSENKDFFEKELEAIRVGEKEMVEKFGGEFRSINEKIPAIASELKSTISGFEQRLEAAKQAEQPKIVYEQVEIAETGDIIEIEKNQR